MNFIGGVSVVGLVIVLQEKRKRDLARLRRFVGLRGSKVKLAVRRKANRRHGFFRCAENTRVAELWFTLSAKSRIAPGCSNLLNPPDLRAGPVGCSLVFVRIVNLISSHDDSDGMQHV
jgi:hypothetical protein